MTQRVPWVISRRAYPGFVVARSWKRESERDSELETLPTAMAEARSHPDGARETSMLKWTLYGAALGTGAMLLGCGYTDLEMAAKQRQIDALVAEVHALKASPAPACSVEARRTSPAISRPILSSR
jgi:hypothetical protein